MELMGFYYELKIFQNSWSFIPSVAIYFKFHRPIFDSCKIVNLIQYLVPNYSYIRWHYFDSANQLILFYHINPSIINHQLIVSLSLYHNTQFQKIRETCFWNICHVPQNNTTHPGILPTKPSFFTVEVQKNVNGFVFTFRTQMEISK